MIKEKWHLFLKKWNDDWKLQVSTVFTGLFILSLLYQCQPQKLEQLEAMEKIFLDQMLPAGHSLFPLETQNIEALKQIIGPKGVVDLYDSSSNQLIASGVKVLRAPNAPDVILAMVLSPIASKIAQMGPNLIAVLQNPNEKVGTNFVKQKLSRKRQIIYNQGAE